MPSLSHLTSCTSTKCKLYPANSLAAAVSEPALYGLLTLQVPNLMSILRCLVRTKVLVQVQGFLCEKLRNKFFLRWVVSTSPNLQAGGPPLAGCPRLLIQYIRSYRPYWRPFLPSATWRRAMPWWQGPAYYEVLSSTLYNPTPVFSSRLICYTPLYKHCLLGFR